jgi:hypothetical protein
MCLARVPSRNLWKAAANDILHVDWYNVDFSMDR